MCNCGGNRVLKTDPEGTKTGRHALERDEKMDPSGVTLFFLDM